jgi:predicted PurR-regulated permease PerM
MLRDQNGELNLDENSNNPNGERSFISRVVVFYGIGAIFFIAISVLWLTYHVLLVVFACILLAILLDSASARVERRLGVRRWASLGLVVLATAAVCGLAGWLMAPQVAVQTHELMSAIPQALQRLRSSLEQSSLLKQVLGMLPSQEQMGSNASSLMKSAGLAFSGVFGALGNTILIAFVGIYLAAQPRLYIDGMVALLPKKKRPRAHQVMQQIGQTLAQWLTGKLLSMIVVGVATAVGLGLLGVPLALVLGVVAGLADFIPYIGPLLAAVPAVLLAFSESPALALYVVLFFIAIQFAEGYLLQPLVERKTVSLPPALTISMQVLFGSLFGLAGVALATPLTAVIMVVIIMLYIQDTLGDPLPTPVEQQAEKDSAPA